MFKTVVKLFRARVHGGEEKFSDACALTPLDQQIRDCAAALTKARKAAAFAVAQAQTEKRRLAALEAGIADLESRACTALRQGRDDLAMNAAGLMADLEADRDAAACALARHESAGEKISARLRKSEARLAELNRRRALARAQKKLGRLRRDARDDNPFRAGFAEAEATLARLNARIRLADDAEAALAGFGNARSPRKMAEKLAQAGCGPRLRATAEDVFARLRAKTCEASACEVNAA
jgi:phage shock protein A